MFILLELSETVSCHRRCHARRTPSPGSGGFRNSAFNWKISEKSRSQEFLARDPGVVHHPERATINRLLLILREIGVLKTELPQPLTSVQECVNEYRQYLVRQRGLSEASLPNHLSFVEQFLSGRTSGPDLRLTELSASDVTGFVKSRAANLSPGRTKLLVTALRSSLRYLLHQGKISVNLVPCVLPVGRFLRYRSLCRPVPCNEFWLSMIGRRQSVDATTRSYCYSPVWACEPGRSSL